MSVGRAVCLGLWILGWGSLESAPAEPGPGSVQVRFLDSATGCAVRPESLTVESEAAGNAVPGRWSRRAGAAPSHSLRLDPGRHRLTALSTRHAPMTAQIEVDPDSPYRVQVRLDPLELPRELQPEVVAGWHRPDATLIQGFVVDDDSGEPLSGAGVQSLTGEVAAGTDARGFFQLYLPAIAGAPASVTDGFVVEFPGYRGQERRFVELWPNGDWTYRIRLRRGAGREWIDERQGRRFSLDQAAAAPPEPPKEPAAPSALEPSLAEVPRPLGLGPANATVRVPRNIRVLQQDGTTIDYVSLDYYCKHVLPAEWIAGWAAYTGGSNSLNAGAVALRTYAIGYVNSPRSGSYDICGTTACQAYRPDVSSSYSDTAVNFTANYVEVNASGAISSGLTEYSAENNSLASACGDGFTAPSGTCLYDPVCAGESRNGHGRGMCQWGTAKWATGLKFPGNSTSDHVTLNGYPRRDWVWICQHYYPTLTLVKGVPLMVGDDIRALSTVNVRACTGGGITNGVSCPSVASKAAGATGTILAGPLLVTNDATKSGYTWYQVRWSDAVVGWSVENYLERVFAAPTAPGSLAAAAAGTNQINLSWADGSGGAAAGFKLERAPGPTGPWLPLAATAGTVVAYQDKNLYAGSTWSYRVRAFNAAGYSAYSPVATATTSNPPPALAAIVDRAVTEETLVTFTNAAATPDTVALLTDFEPFPTETANGTVLFRDPTNSPSTAAFLAGAPDLAAITDVFTAAGNGSARALRIQCFFTNSNPWLRLTTAGAATLPNPVIDFTKRLRFSVYCDRAVKIALGCRETGTPAGTALGADGGTTGNLEWAGVTNLAGTAPMPTRLVPAGAWTTLTFDLPHEPIRSFAGGNGVLPAGLGVLEHLAIVPAAGLGVYNLYLDNFAVVAPRALTYSLGPGAPAGAAVDAGTGVFTWTPQEAQGPATNTLALVVADDSLPPVRATNTFKIVVAESNRAPVLAAVPDRTVHAGGTVCFTNDATDADLPANRLTFSLEGSVPAGASVEPATGVFVWATSDALAGVTNQFTVRVSDDGVPAQSATRSFAVVVAPRPGLQSARTEAGLTLRWSAIPGTSYRVQYKDTLAEPGWRDLAPVRASAATAGWTDVPGPQERYYRVLVLGPE